MKQSIIVWALMAGMAVAQGSPAKSLEEWKKLREELRKQGLPVASRVQTAAEMEADIARVRREMEKQPAAGGEYQMPVSDLQRNGGGSVPVPKKPKGAGLSGAKLQGAKGLR